VGTTSKRVCSVIEEGRKAFFKSDQGGSVNPNNSALRLSVLAAEPHPASAAPVPAIPGPGGHEQLWDVLPAFTEASIASRSLRVLVNSSTLAPGSAAPSVPWIRPLRPAQQALEMAY
tara:strand:- start:1234 stop:1584 length:351 start_codon:yes stop_codon:yes gene_type:complete